MIPHQILQVTRAVVDRGIEFDSNSLLLFINFSCNKFLFISLSPLGKEFVLPSKIWLDALLQRNPFCLSYDVVKREGLLRCHRRVNKI